jgi:hypothetical protein
MSGSCSQVSTVSHTRNFLTETKIEQVQNSTFSMRRDEVFVLVARATLDIK